MATEDLCLVCADSLDFTGFGPCGHKEACSRCVARLRFIMEDNKCIFCKQDNTSVFFTRYMGDYTHGLAPEDFGALQERSEAGEVYALREVNGYFDDQEHFKTIKSLCSFTHPLVHGTVFNTLAALKRRLMDTHKLMFCDLCIKGRKVFISEQVLYSKADLERHMRTGDDTGPLAESGFKGHPLCRFCRQRFYDGDELYRHMESRHEHCFICRRAQPAKFVYFKDYAELDGACCALCVLCAAACCVLRRRAAARAAARAVCCVLWRAAAAPHRAAPSADVATTPAAPRRTVPRRATEHFQSQHHPCPHPACLERKFVVFAEESDLRRHFAAEHGSDANMSRAQRRQALALNIQLTYSSREQEEAAAAAALARPGVVIGGGHNLPRRGGRAGGGGMRHSASDGAMAAALAASVESSRAESAARAAAANGPASVTFSAEEFPSVSGQGPSGAAPLGTWVAGTSSAGAGASLTQEDFPALPTASRHQRRRQRERERNSLAARLATANAPVRVVNRAAAPTPAEAAAGPSAAPRSGAGVRHSQSAGSLPAAAAAAAAASSAASTATDDEVDGVGGFDSDAPPAGASAHASEAFPALPGAPAPAAAQAHPGWVPVRRKAARQQGPAGAAPASSQAPAAPTSIADFPSLAAALQPAARRPAGVGSSRGRPAAAAASGRGGAGAGASSRGAPTVAAAVAAAGGVSEELKAANRELVERCKAALSDEGFRDFKQTSAAFMQGGMDAGAYHRHVLELGLLQLVPQLAALCPDADKRAALVEVHRRYLEASHQELAAPAGRGLKGWVPPEAARAALEEAEAKGSWACERCTLVNAPSSRACEVCSAPRPKPGSAKPPAAGASSSSSSSSSSGAGAGSSRGAGTSGAPAPSPWSSAARAGSSSAAAPQQPPHQPPPQQPAQAPPPAAAESWPTLPGGGGSSSRGRAAAAAAAQQQQQPEVEDAAGSSSSSSSKKKKPQKTSLHDLLASGKSHPQNAWSQPQRMAHVTQPSGFTAGLGDWGKKGGAKLAKKFSALDEACKK